MILVASIFSQGIRNITYDNVLQFPAFFIVIFVLTRLNKKSFENLNDKFFWWSQNEKLLSNLLDVASIICQTAGGTRRRLRCALRSENNLSTRDFKCKNY